MATLKHMIQLVLGDWSDDGHGKTYTSEIRSNFSHKEICAAYKVGTKKVGFDLVESICEEYEDNLLRKKELDILINNGLTLDIIYGGAIPTDKWSKKAIHDVLNNQASKGLHIGCYEFVNIYLFIVKLGDSSFQYRMLTRDEFPSINIGGYGLLLD